MQLSRSSPLSKNANKLVVRKMRTGTWVTIGPRVRGGYLKGASKISLFGDLAEAKRRVRQLDSDASDWAEVGHDIWTAIDREKAESERLTGRYGQ